MAIANWLNVSPTSGSGNGTVNVKSTTENTGRNARNTTLRWTASGVSAIDRNVLQKGKPEYVTMDDNASAPQSGASAVTIKGKSNSSKLTFRLGTGDLQVSLPSTYKANSLITNNGVAISGDPGATQEYDFSITFSVPANSGVTAISRQIIVRNDEGDEAICVLTLAAGEPYVTIPEGDIVLEYTADSSATVQVQSNTNWTIS